VNTAGRLGDHVEESKREKSPPPMTKRDLLLVLAAPLALFGIKALAYVGGMAMLLYALSTAAPSTLHGR
jgi:hypothetical protein